MDFRRIVLIAAGLMAPALNGCGTDRTDLDRTVNPASGVGSVQMQLRLPNGTTIDTVGYDITNSGGFDRAGDVPVSNSNVVRFQVGNIPAATGYQLALSARTSDGVQCSSTPVAFDVVAKQTALVVATLRCGAGGVSASNAGNVRVDVDVQNAPRCGEVDGLTALPLEVNVGGTIALQGYATAGDSPATFSWTVAPSAAGGLAPASDAVTTFTCAQAGSASITLSVTTGSACAASTVDVPVTCTGATVDAGPAPDAAVDAGPAPDAAIDAGPAPDAAIDAAPEPDAAIDAAPEPDAAIDAAPQPDAAVDAAPQPDAAIDASPEPDAAVDAGPAPDAAVDAGPAPDAGGGPSACTLCRRNNCTAYNDIDLVSGCFVAPNADFGADPADPTFIQQCLDTVACAQANGCAGNASTGGSGCYCGSATADACNTSGPAADAKCVPQWQAAARSSVNADVQARFSDFAYPSGWAFFLLECDRINCSNAAAGDCTQPGTVNVP